MTYQVQFLRELRAHGFLEIAMKTYPDYSFEKNLWRKGIKIVAGLDEVGRGAFAGPVVAGCVVFSKMLNAKFQMLNEIEINDSKKLTKRQREVADEWIKTNCMAWGIGQASVTQINKMGIGKASKIAFRKAIYSAQNKIDPRIEYLLIDAFFVPYTKGINKQHQQPIIHGDEKSLSIAAASIIAKVYRDSLMKKLSKNPKLKIYRWDENKGYGTSKHQKAIKKHGPSRYHRKKFVETFINNQQGS